MAKIPFDIKYRPQIESGEYKAILECGVEAEILAWEQPGEYPIICVAKIDDAIPFRTDGNGKAYHYPEGVNYSDLFLVTTKEEPSEFEKAVGCAITDAQLIPRDKDGIANIHDIDEFIRKKAAELLTLAHEQFIKDGFVIEKKAFHDAVEKVSPEVMKEVSENIGQLDPLEQYRKGREDALKDLPRWRKYSKGTEIDPFALVRFSDGSIGRSKYASEDCYVLEVKDMLKLPGFKED